MSTLGQIYRTRGRGVGETWKKAMTQTGNGKTSGLVSLPIAETSCRSLEAKTLPFIYSLITAHFKKGWWLWVCRISVWVEHCSGKQNHEDIATFSKNLRHKAEISGRRGGKRKEIRNGFYSHIHTPPWN